MGLIGSKYCRASALTAVAALFISSSAEAQTPINPINPATLWSLADTFSTIEAANKPCVLGIAPDYLEEQISMFYRLYPEFLTIYEGMRPTKRMIQEESFKSNRIDKYCSGARKDAISLKLSGANLHD